MRAIELKEMVQPNAKAIGGMHIAMVERTKNTMEPVNFNFGTAKFQVKHPIDKKWLLDVWAGYRRIGKEDKFLEMMGTLPGFELLLDQHAIWQQRQQEQQRKQKKPGQRPMSEQSTPRAARQLEKLRMRYPQAANDSEALLFAMLDAEKQSRNAMKQADAAEKTIDKKVDQTINSKISSIPAKDLSAASLAQVQAMNDKQQEIINDLVTVDQAQQQDIDQLKGQAPAEPDAAVRPLPQLEPQEQPPTTAPVVPAAVPTAAPATPAVPAAPAAPPAQEPEQAPTKIRIPPSVDQPELDLEPDVEPSANVIPLRPPKQKQLKLPLPKPQTAAGGIQRIAEAKQIEKKLQRRMKLWKLQGII